MRLRVGPFRAMVPRRSAKLLKDEEAQLALDARLDKLGLRGLPKHVLVEEPAKIGAVNSIYLFNTRAFRIFSAAIIGFNATNPVQVRSPDHNLVTGDAIYLRFGYGALPTITAGPAGIVHGFTYALEGSNFGAAQGTVDASDDFRNTV